MKSERRHELQHNTLDAELGRGVDFFRRHVGTMLWAVVIFCAVLLVTSYVRKHMRARDSEHRNAFIAAMSQEGLLPSERIEQLRPVADQTRDEAVAIEALFMMANLRIEGGMRQLMPPEEAAKLAEESYREVIERFSHHPIQVANAYIGLALLAENERDFDKAAEHYRAAIAVEGAGGSPATRLAEYYSESLPSLSRPLGLTPTEELGAPGTMPGVGDDPAAFPLPGIGAGDGDVPSPFPPADSDEPIDPFGPTGP